MGVERCSSAHVRVIWILVSFYLFIASSFHLQWSFVTLLRIVELGTLFRLPNDYYYINTLLWDLHVLFIVMVDETIN